ncbi:MAG TPA: DPP IV N-terminal domain-containing protein [Gemmatimonadaceae bacterium]|nr:DPP IV N-terminal domain-containing protein [Gemmatimonadaceae bacterium]
MHPRPATHSSDALPRRARHVRAPFQHRWTVRRAAGTVLLAACGATPLLAQASAPPTPAQPAQVNHANWELAERFNSSALRPMLYSTNVEPHWLGKSDSLWYNWRDSDGSHFYLAVPTTRTKRPLFNQVKLAAALSETSHRAVDADNLPFRTLTFTTNHKSIRFTVDSVRYSWNLATQAMTSLGRIPADSVLPDEEHEQQTEFGRRGGGRGRGRQRDFRNFSPDSSAFVFAKDHNLYLVEVGRPDTVQITTDGVKDYSYGFQDTSRIQFLEQNQRREARKRARDPRVRANVVWSPDSRAFAGTRNDSRKVKDLYLINSLAQPRPTLYTYKYAMPGEVNVPQQELFVYRRGDKAVKQLNVHKWRDQRLMDVHWTTGSDKVRLVRRDRLQRNLELIEVNVATDSIRTLLTETVKHAALDPEPVRYVHRGGDMIWWSERSGWGQYYLYDFNGHFKRPLTTGAWHADRIVQVDTLRGVVWLTGEGREPGENPYFEHLYRVNGDGTGFALVDSGDYNHDETLSPTKRYSVDNYSRVDYPTRSVIRDATGRVVMKLESADVSRLVAMGWKPPKRFVVKAADGITDIYGNMWKPFDFDSTKKYPIIANVYPGPQTESVNIPFSANGLPQELAQLGFIVIQLGNRGGSPLRSEAYHRYGYYNLRDYALADKKAGIEELAERYPFIDINRVGIYGHSGGGFLTAAAMLEPPYNDFFKVGVASSGNHDNNIYNQNWSEENHGLRLIARGSAADSGRARGGRRGRRQSPGPSVMSDTMTADDSLQFQIHVPTNIELAPNLKGDLLLVTGDMDNNVHPANTIRLVNALIKANKRFDFMIMPGKPHGYGDLTPYFDRMLMEYFAEHLLGDYYRNGAIYKYK